MVASSSIQRHSVTAMQCNQTSHSYHMTTAWQTKHIFCVFWHHKGDDKENDSPLILYHGSWETEIMEPKETAVARERPINMFLLQWICDTIIEEMLEIVFSIGSVLRLHKENQIENVREGNTTSTPTSCNCWLVGGKKNHPVRAADRRRRRGARSRRGHWGLQ